MSLRRTRSSARSTARLALGLGLTAAALGAGCEPELGELPATCDASAGAEACPEGLACIEGVCAAPGTRIPSTLARLQYLRPVDLRLIAVEGGALAVWQEYDYDAELHAFVGARIGVDGAASAPFTLVGDYPANANYLEPYFDVIASGPSTLHLSVGAAPYDDDDPRSRLSHFVVSLPAAGSTSGATADARWEERMRTLGYGAVSRPRLQLHEGGLRVAYFESLVDEAATLGELAVFDLEASGDRVDPPACAEEPCCLANRCAPTRSGSTVAIGVVDALRTEGTTAWILDDTRPSFVLQPDADTAAEPLVTGALPRLAVPVALEPDALLFLQPSARGGDGFAFDPVTGAAALMRVDLPSTGAPGAPVQIGTLPEVRDTPRPVWIAREGKDALLVTPGADLEAPTILVYAVGPASGDARVVAEVKRYSTVPVTSVQAVVVGGKLILAWIDEQSDSGIVRSLAIDEP